MESTGKEEKLTVYRQTDRQTDSQKSGKGVGAKMGS